MQLVLLPDEPFRFRPRDRDEVRRHVHAARVELVSGDDCSWHGVRTLRGVRLVEGLIWGEESDPDFAGGEASC